MVLPVDSSENALVVFAIAANNRSYVENIILAGDGLFFYSNNAPITAWRFAWRFVGMWQHRSLDTAPACEC